MIEKTANKKTKMKIKTRIIHTILFLSIIMTGTIIGTGTFASVDKTALNLDFENGNTGWTNPEGTFIYNSPTGTSSSGGKTWDVSGIGTAMAKLQPNTSNQNFTTVSTTLNLSTDSYNYLVGVFPRITNTSYIYKDINLVAGDVFTMAWNYVAIDYTPFNDASIATLVNKTDPGKPALINGRYAETVILGATVPGTANYTTGSYGATGWQTVTFKATTTGTYRLGFATYNLDDTGYSPILYIDDAKGTTLLNGQPFAPVGQDPDAPEPQPIKGLIYDKNYFIEGNANDGSITESINIILNEETFTGTNGSIIPATVNNLPAGLAASIIRTSDTTATLSLTGKALNNSIDDSISNLEIIFPDSAFTGNNAGEVLGYTVSDFEIRFNHFAIIYNLDGGKNNIANPKDYEQGSGTITLADPTKSGYVFSGWYDAVTGGNKITKIETTNGGNVTIFARWVVERTITYNLAGGINNIDNPDKYIEGNKVSLKAPTREGYYFDGWYTSALGGSLMLSIPETSTGNLTLYARWIKATIESPPSRELSPIVYNLIEGINFTEEEMAGSYSARMTFAVVTKEETDPLVINLIGKHFGVSDTLTMKNYVLEIKIYKIVNDVETIVTELSSPVTISFVVPEELRDKDLKLVRIHEGELSVLDYSYDETSHVLTFTSDKFSTYTLSYAENIVNMPKTGGFLGVAASIGIIGSGLVVLWFTKRKVK
ncbi:MAG: InlB B-repeat-containing protein [Firmicutes bacterium]|nr:InlB B-repeat-containing protein [Bacillota bacterium]